MSLDPLLPTHEAPGTPTVLDPSVPILSPANALLETSASALYRSQEHFRLLVQGVADYAIYMLDPEGRIVSWNSGAEHIKGYVEDEVLSRHVSMFYTPEDREAGYPERNLGLAREEGRYEGEGWRVRKDGSRFFAHVVIDRLNDAQGHLMGFAKITRDITAKRQAEETLLAAREALFQAQKSEMIGQLTGGVAHDFNNLLMAVIGNLELLQKRLPPGSREQVLLNNAMAGANRGAALTQRLLAFARKQQLRPRSTHVPSLIHGMGDLLHQSLGPGVTTHITFPGNLPPVLVDPHQLELAVLNLAVNGRDAMLAGGTLQISALEEHVSVGHSTDLRPGAYVCLSVKDEGLGMDETTLARATEPFFTTKGVGKGTGLGLSMAHGLAEQSGGRLAIKSQPGRGTEVQIWLPVAKMGAQAPPAFLSEAARAGDQPSRSLNVLVVDDDDLVLSSTAAQLQDLGHVVHTASSAEQALSMVEHPTDLDLVVTDHAMPGMTGTDLAARLLQTHPAMPIILASGYTDLPSLPHSDVVYLSKPFNQKQLQKAMVEVLDRAEKTT